MRVAMIGTRGVPARYGGFETAVEEVGSRLVKLGHEVTVYCRGNDTSEEHLGMKRVVLPALRHPTAETLSHTALSVAHLLRNPVDVALVFNAANAPLLPLIRAARIPVAVHVDGLEWKRAKWGPTGRRYYLANERLAVKLADELIADAAGIQDYYRAKFDSDSVLLTYGAPIITTTEPAKLQSVGLESGKYHLVVARMEPENHVDVIVDGYRRSDATLPLVVVGTVPYASAYEQRVQAMADTDPRIRMLGGVWDQDLLNSLYAGCASYLHGHSVGGTNPSLLRAMGAGANVIAWDVNFNREVLGEGGTYFGSPSDLPEQLRSVESDPGEARVRGAGARARAEVLYRWDAVADGYEQLCQDLVDGRRSLAIRRQATSQTTSIEAPVSIPEQRPVSPDPLPAPQSVA
ncbi:DUF1972 domain-containing protein [Pseudonocardia sp. KRD-184]|uniref:DUF1972 domain-containing protein n=1 Tax=Pseudonocardia oceani TaxID=2792013 RepID=A0ABS6U5H0_9PSEU|nr:DUF1972 domain-containing protein [Pseudonocardia oceani]MBW0089575.1 DUF1972 domain-containing protein [Pseudonocardia oceani]MBW0096501.1 DUF1972 domain-containing protein [Pseudonocardia oceani]MBW0122757.1 DUF1972 domain-containing protein [Pseudonocardia oceani]MBW0127485.1 DUF1972 domain-containing protein [Pseudonocardia oceani]